MTPDGASPLRILLVEDNPGDIHLIREAIEGSRIEASLTVVTDGKEALDFLYRREGYSSASRPGLTILDLNVPKVTGRTVLERIKTEPELSSIPVLVFSGTGSEDDVYETYELGADSFYTKPTDPNEFISVIRGAGETLVESGQLPAGRYAEIDRGG